MQDLKQLNELLDRAKEAAGSDYRLAQALCVPRQHVSAWRKGTRAPTPEEVAMVAAEAGLDAQAWLVRATLEKHEGTAKGDQLARVLGKCLLATGAVLASGGVSAAAICSHISSAVLFACSTMYRRVKLRHTQ